MTQAVALATLGNGPAFSAYRTAAQAIPSGTFTKLLCETEEFDTNSNYDNTTNFRFTPTVAGYYQINGEFILASAAPTALCAIFKNGAEFKRGGQGTVQANFISALVFLNGTTDYVELFLYQSSGGSINITTGTTSQTTNYFQAAMVRGA